MQIFISYSSKSRSLVERLSDDLKNLGHLVWYDQSLTGGHNWWATILHEIRQCELFIIAITEPYIDSDPCRREYEYAFALNKTVVPISLDKADIKRLPTKVLELQIVDYRKRTHRSSIALMNTLTHLPPAKPLPDPLPPEPDAPISPLNHLRDQIHQRRLSANNQWSIVNTLRDFARKPADAEVARGLLDEMLKRDDLLLKVANEINAILGEKPPQTGSFSGLLGTSSGAMVLSSESATSHSDPMVDYIVERVRYLEQENIRLAGEVDKIKSEQLEKDKARVESELTQLRSGPVQALVQQIDHDLEKGDWSKLIAGVDDFQIQVKIEYPQLYLKRGLAHQEQGNFDLAIRDYTKAIALNPHDAAAYNNRGFVYQEKGELDKALADFNRAIALDPHDAAAYNNRGAAVFEEKGELDKALADFNRAIALDPHDAVAYNNRGAIYGEIGELDKALADFNRATELDPHDALTYRNRATLLFQNNRLVEALADCETAARLEPDDPVAHNNRAFVLFHLGRVDEAEVAWKTATDLPEAPDLAFAGHAVSLQKLGKRDLARQQYQTAIKMDARWRNDLDAIAKEYMWTDDMIELAREILRGLKRK